MRIGGNGNNPGNQIALFSNDVVHDSLVPDIKDPDVKLFGQPSYFVMQIGIIYIRGRREVVKYDDGFFRIKYLRCAR